MQSIPINQIVFNGKIMDETVCFSKEELMQMIELEQEYHHEYNI
ncbi:MAG: hypothetical protein ACWGNI_00420 [Desulfobacterales bacterium]